MPTGFVGREGELAVLRQTLARAAAGQPGAALVTGEPGSGKSALLAEAARRWGFGTAIRATGYEPMRSIPLGAAGELLRRLAAVPDAGATLERLVFAPTGGGAVQPLRVFEAAHRALCALGPVLLLVDDLQWLDERSLALLQYLLRAAAPAQRRFAILAAARPSAAALALRDAMRAELPEQRAATVELGPLGVDEGVSLVRAIDASLDEPAAAALWRSAQGSPFWLEALARRHGGGSGASAIEDRLRALSGDASTLLGILAVAARPLDTADAERCVDGEPDRLRHAVRELSVQGLAGESPAGLRVTHDLIRDEVVRLLPAAARRRLHATLATALEAAAGDDARLLLEALEHRVAAGLPAAALAARVLAAPNRRALVAANLELLARIGDDLPAGSVQQMELDAGIATLAAAAGAQELALSLWLRAGRRSDDTALRVRAATGAARAAIALNRPGDARAHVDSARALEPDGAATHVELDALEAQVDLWLDHRTADGSRRAQRALDAARALAERAGGIDRLDAAQRRAHLLALEVATEAAFQEDRAVDMVALAEEGVAVARGLGEEAEVAALLRSALGLRLMARIAETEQRFRAAWEAARRAVLPAQALQAGYGLCQGLRDLGRLAEARAVGAEALELEGRLQNVSRNWQRTGLVLRSVELLLAGGDAALRGLRHDAEIEPDPHVRLASHQAIALWVARCGGPAEAREVRSRVDRALADADSAGCPRCTAELRLTLAETLARIGDVARGRELLAAVASDGVREHPMRAMWRLRAESILALAGGDVEAALPRLAGLVAELDRAGLVPEAVWWRVDQARALATADRRQAVAVLTAAAELAERSGAVAQQRIVARELRRLGVRAWRRGAAAGDDALASLSVREREVVELLAAGRSNAEIAGVLVVSPKTVERHVTNVLAKLSLRNRTEVAALRRATGTGFPR